MSSRKRRRQRFQQSLVGPALRFRRLEPRRVLNASFTIAGTQLDLFDFVATSGVPDLEISYDAVDSQFDFTLSVGNNWIMDGITDTGSNVLSVDDTTLTGLLNVNSALATDVTFVGSVAPLDSVTIVTGGNVQNAVGATVTVTNALQATGATIQLGTDATDTINFGSLTFNSAGDVNVTAQSDITVAGPSTAADAKLTAVGVTSDIAVNGTVTATGDLFLDADGNVTQTAAITSVGLGLMVDGTTTLNNAGNNVTTLAASNGGQTLFTDANALAVGSVTVDGMTVTGITTSDDDVKLTVAVGDLAINESVTLGAGDLFLDVTGNVTQTAAITSAGLGLMVDGTTTLNNVGNNVTTLAASNDGQTLFTDANTLAIGSVTVDGMTVTGITTSDDDVKLTVAVGDLAINEAVALGAGDLFLDVTGNVTQTAAITSAGLGLMVDGTTTLNNAGNNVTTLAASNGGQTLFTDANTLAIGSVTVDGMTVTGITTSDDDVKLTVAVGDLAINEAVTLGAGDLFLDVTGNVTQTAAITSAGLGLMVDGTTTLNNAGNNVTTLAASNGGQTLFTDANALAIGSVTVDGMTVTGITTSDDDVKLTVAVGDLAINEAVTLGAGDLFLDVTGNVTQTAAITSAGLGLMVDGTTTLNNAGNNVTTLAASNGGQTLFTDANALAVGSVTVDGMTVTGITTSDDDVKLTVAVGDLAINEAVTLGAGDLFLDVTGNVTQTAAITSAGLGLMVDGTTTLNNAGNNVTTLAASNGGQTLFTDANALAVGSVTVDGMTVTGITTSDDDVKLTVAVGDLAINEAVALGAGDLFLDVTGNVTQTAAITSAGLGLMVDGTTTLNNAGNNVTTLAASNGGQTLFTDTNALAVGSVTVDGMTVTGITTSDDDVKLTVAVGDLAINEAVTLGAGALFLDVTGNVTQTAAITSAGLGLMVDGTTTLNNAGNNVTTLAASNGGQTLFTDANTLAVGSVTVDGMTVTGITTSDDDVKLTVAVGDLAINEAVTLGAGDLFLDVTGNVTQTAAITSAGLGLMVDGTTTLNNAGNNVTTLAASNGGQTLFTDANTLAVGSVTVDGMTVTGITTSDDDVKLTVAVGDLAINEAVALGAGDLFLDVTGNVTQTAAITSAGLGLMVDGTTTLNNAGNNVTTLAASNGGQTLFTDTNALAVGSVTVDGMTVMGITTSDDDVKLTVAVGDLAINESVTLGAGDLFLDVTGNVTQTAAITSAGLGLMVDGTTTLNNAGNNVTTLAASNGGQTLFTDANTLAIGSVTVDGMTVTGITTSDDDVKLTVAVGDLAINESVTLGAGDLFLDVTGNVTQTAAITSAGLGLMVDGTTTLNNAGNNVTTLAAANGDTIQFTNSGALAIGSVTVDGMTVDDVVAPADITITAASISDADSVPDNMAPIDYDVSGQNVTLTATTGSIGVVGDIFKGTVNALEVEATGNLVASALAGAIALTPNVAGTTTLNSPNVALISLGTLNIADITVTGDLRIEAADVVANDGTIDLVANRILFVSGQSETISVTASILDATIAVDNSAIVSDLVVNSTTDIELLDLNCDNVALQTTTRDSSTTSGLIEVRATGSITVSDDVIAGNDSQTNSSGSVLLSATGATSDILINDVVLTDEAAITIQAADDVRMGSPTSPNDAADSDDLVVVTTVDGRITITADADGSTNGVGGEFFMVDGARILAGRDIAADYVPGTDGNPSPSTLNLVGAAPVTSSNQVTIVADENVTLGSVQTSDVSVDAIRITSTSAGIVDGGDSHTDLVANFDGALVSLRAVTGIGSTNALEGTVHALDANNADALNPDTSVRIAADGHVVVNELAAGGDLHLVNANNDATSGDIRISVSSGRLMVTDAAFSPNNADFGVTNENGNILLEATDDVVIGSNVTSDSGHITLASGDDVDVNANVLTSDVGPNAGGILIEAGNSAADAVGPEVDGINIDAAVATTSGGILLNSARDIRTTAVISSLNGNIGLVAVNDIEQNANVTTSTGDALIAATAGAYTMAAGTITSAMTNLVAVAGGAINLGRVSATNVALSAGGDISDSAADNAVNVTATNLSMRSTTGGIGAPDAGAPGVNVNAIDTDVAVVAAESNSGIYIQEIVGVLPDNDLRIDRVNAVTVDVAVTRVSFDGTTSPASEARTVNPLDDLTSGGPIKVVALDGSITVTDGLDGDEVGIETSGGDVLLEARANMVGDVHNVTTQTAIHSFDIGTGVGGHITVTASDNVQIGDDVRTDGTGTIFIEAQTGTLSVADGADIDVEGIVSDAGDILLRAGTDMTLDATVTSISGDIGLDAGGSITQNVNVTTGTGDILANAGGTYTMAAGATMSATAVASTENILLIAGGIIRLGALSADHIGVMAGGDVIDNNAGLNNIRSDSLNLRSVGSVGTAADPLEISVDVLAIDGDGGIFLVEDDAIRIDNVPALSVSVDGVMRANFNSTTSAIPAFSRTVATLDDLTSDGSIALESLAGSITVRDGLDGDELGVQSTGAGDITLEAGGAGSDITTDTGVESLDTPLGPGGNIRLVATGMVSIGDDLRTDGLGTIFVQAQSGSITVQDSADPDIDGIVSDAGTISLLAGGDIVLGVQVVSTSGDISAVAAGEVRLNSLVSTQTGNLVLEATSGAILETSAAARVVGNDLSVTAGLFAHLHDTQVNRLVAASVGANGALAEPWQVLNATANDTGDDFFDVLDDVNSGTATKNVAAQIAALDRTPSDFQYQNRFGTNYALYLVNTGDLEVGNVTAGTAAPDAPNIYLETKPAIAPVEAGNLNVTGTVTSNSSIATPGGLVMIAGGDLAVSGSLITTVVTTMPAVHQRLNAIGPIAPVAGELGNDVVFTTFFDGGDGLGQPGNPNLTSTRFIIRPDATQVEDFQTHLLQRVVIQFGNDALEAGFLSVISYADGTVQLFDTRGEEGIPAELMLDGEPIEAFPRTDITDAAVFTRSTEFDAAFLNQNQELPTMAVLRRADNFFLFADGGNTDLTVESKEIENVFSLGGQSGAPVPSDPVPMQAPGFAVETVIFTIETPTQITAPEIELSTPVQKSIDVAIYQVNYIDGNSNGQVEADELPSYRDILEDIGKEGFSKEQQDSKIPIEPAKAGETPTQEDIERKKNELLDDPNQPSGAYAIIREDADGNRTVLDVFGIRDWPEEVKDQPGQEPQREAPLPELKPFEPGSKSRPEDNSNSSEVVPPPVEVDGPQEADTSQVLPAVQVDGGQSRMASTGLLLGTLWMMRSDRRRVRAETTEDARREVSQGCPNEYSRSARRRRRWQTEN